MKRFLTAVVLMCVVLGAVAKPKNQTESYAFMRGMEAYDASEPDVAITWFEKEIEDNPNNTMACLYLTKLYIYQEKLGRAISVANLAVKNAPKKDKAMSAAAYYSRSAIYLNMEDTIKAMTDLNEAIRLQPNEGKYREDRAQLFYEQDDYDQAEKDYLKLIELDEGDPLGHMGLGRNYKAQKRWDEAIDKFTYVIKLAPEYTGGYSFRAESYIGQDKWDKAADDIIYVLNNDFDLKSLVLMHDFKDENLEMLLTKMRAQVAKNPNSLDWHYYLGSLLESNKRYEEAIEQYDAYNKLDADPSIYHSIAICNYYLGRNKAAVAALDKAVQLTEDVYHYTLKSAIQTDMGDFDDAIETASKCIELDPTQSTGYSLRADAKYKLGDANGALGDLNIAVTLQPEEMDSRFNRGKIYYLQGDTVKAAADMEEVLKLNQAQKSLDKAYESYAYMMAGKPDKAIEIMDKVIADDNDSGAYYNAACLYSLMNNKPKAIENLQKCVEMGEKNYDHMLRDIDFVNIRETDEFKAILEKIKPTNEEDVNLEEDEVAVKRVTEVPFVKEAGITKVKCSINELPLYFYFDTGANDVTISMVEANFMLKNGYITSDDIIGSTRYMDANGNVNEGTVLNLKKVDFAGFELENVRASVVRNQKAPLLLGQSVLGRLGRIEIDNERKVLKITN